MSSRKNWFETFFHVVFCMGIFMFHVHCTVKYWWCRPVIFDKTFTANKCFVVRWSFVSYIPIISLFCYKGQKLELMYFEEDIQWKDSKPLSKHTHTCSELSREMEVLLNIIIRSNLRMHFSVALIWRNIKTVLEWWRSLTLFLKLF